LFQRKGRCPAANGDALPELAKFVALELCFQFGLTCEHDLKEFLPRRFKIQEQSNFFQRSGFQALRLVDNQYRNLTGAILLKQPAIEGH